MERGRKKKKGNARLPHAHKGLSIFIKMEKPLTLSPPQRRKFKRVAKRKNTQLWKFCKESSSLCGCQWSFRRFTYGNLGTTSPSSKCSDLSNYGRAESLGEPGSRATSENFIGTFIGRSDGRCVERAGTYSMRVDDPRLQDIPRCMTNNCKSQSLARREFKRLAKGLLRPADMLVARVSVARVRPRTSKGITDLLLPQTSLVWKRAIVPLRSSQQANAHWRFLAGWGLVR